MVILVWPVPFWTLINYLLNNKQFLLIITPVLLPHYHVPEAVWTSTAAFGVMVAFWQAWCHFWICQQQDAALLCFCHSEQQDKSPCSLLPRGSAQQLPLCQTPLSRLPKQSGPRRESGCNTPGEHSREPLIQSRSSLCTTELRNNSARRVGFCLQTDFLQNGIGNREQFFYFTGTRGSSLVKRTMVMEAKDKLSLVATAIWESNEPLHKAQVVHRYHNLIEQKKLNHQEGGLGRRKVLLIPSKNSAVKFAIFWTGWLRCLSFSRDKAANKNTRNILFISAPFISPFICIRSVSSSSQYLYFSSSPFCWTVNSSFVNIQQGNCLQFLIRMLKLKGRGQQEKKCVKVSALPNILTSKLFLYVSNTAKVPHLV